jgi:hypothetical protein
VDPAARTCDTRILVIRAADGDTFVEQHRQYFHTAAQVLDALLDAGFRLGAVTEEYSHRPADATTLRATWTARRGARDRSDRALHTLGISDHSRRACWPTAPRHRPTL